MAPRAVNIKVVVAAGVSAPDAIKAALHGDLAEFADRHGFPRPNVSMCIHGKQRHERIRQALAAELGVESEWLDDLLDTHAGKAA